MALRGSQLHVHSVAYRRKLHAFAVLCSTQLPDTLRHYRTSLVQIAGCYTGRVAIPMKLKRSEQVAKYVIETIHEGARAEHLLQQSAGEYDIDLKYGDGTSAAVEVTSSTIEDLQQTLAEIGKQGCCVRATACRNSWLVHPLPKARIKLILEKVDRYLSAIEAEGRTEFFAGHGQASSSVSQILHDLQIDEALTLQLPPPACIWVQGPSGQGSMVRPGDLQRAIEVEANKTDNRRKLEASGRAQRHLFVYVEPLNFEPWSALINRCIPEQPPVLPIEVTHVWAAAEVPDDGIVVWVAQRPNGWQDLGVIPGLK